MRKLALLAALAASLLASVPAHAEWVTKEVKWFKSSVGTPWSGTTMYVRDTTYNVFGSTVTLGGALDTTFFFSLKDAIPHYFGPANIAATAARDSVMAGFLIFFSDSSTVPTGAMSSASGILEGRMNPIAWPGVSAAGWTIIDSLTAKCVDGDVAISLPIPALPRRLTTRDGVSPFVFDQLRFRHLAGVGALPSCRVFLRYYRNPQENDQR